MIAALDDRRLIRVRGDDARAFLNNLLTSRVDDLAPGQLRASALLTPQGRMLMDLLLLGEDYGVLIDVGRDLAETLLARLALYRLRAKVEIEAVEGTVHACWPDVVEGFVPDPRLGALGGRAYGPGPLIPDALTPDALTPDALADHYLAHRLALAVPEAADLGDHPTYPIELNFDLLGAIDFHKGCFVGQETTSRMKRRGQVRSRTLALRLAPGTPSPAPGSEVLAGDLRAGQVLRASGALALAIMRLDRMEGPLGVDGAPAALVVPHWLAPHIAV
jgi:folate-binding protein YgfZ